MFDANRLFMILMVYFIAYGLILWFKPGIVFDPSKKGLRSFGVGYKNKTILPIWLLSLVLGIVSYLIVMFYLASPKLF